MDLFTAEALDRGLSTRALGRHAVLLDRVDSTNSEARRMLTGSPADGTVIIAGTQTAGRGRRGRSWVSEEACGLWMTVLMRPRFDLAEVQKLTLLIGLAVSRAAEEGVGARVRPVIKWPNDVLMQGRKLCGILCESANDSQGGRWVIAGIGINTRAPAGGYGQAGNVAISLEEAAGRVVPRLTLAAAVLNRMEALLDSWQTRGFGEVAAGYRQYMTPQGSAVVIIDGEARRHGIVEGLDDDGGLLVRLQDGAVERVISGEISLRGVDGYV